MKKVNTSPRAQARRQRALARFHLDPAKVNDNKHGDAYLARKEVERLALKQRLGV